MVRLSPFNLLTSEACLSKLNAYLNSTQYLGGLVNPDLRVWSWERTSVLLYVEAGTCVVWAELCEDAEQLCVLPAQCSCPKQSRWERCQQSHFSLAGAPGCQQWGFGEAFQQKTHG